MHFQSIISYLCSCYIISIIFLRWILYDLHYSNKHAIRIATSTILLMMAAFSLQEAMLKSIVCIMSITNAIFAYWYLIRGPKPKGIDLNGKVAIVTGANTGIGYETARQLAKMGSHVILACRSESKGKQAIIDIQMSCPDAKLSFYPLDLSSFESIRIFCSYIMDQNLSLNILINNAGLISPDRRKTKDGLEMTMGTNHFGHFLLTSLLLPKLQNHRDSRIINVGSCNHKWPREFLINDLMIKENYSAFKAYNQSKLANMLFTQALSKRLKNTSISVFCVHPGIVLSDISRNFNPLIRVLYKLVRPLAILYQKSASQGAYTSVFAASNPMIRSYSGHYLSNCAIEKPNPIVYDTNISELLWKRSLEIVGMNNLPNLHKF